MNEVEELSLAIANGGAAAVDVMGDGSILKLQLAAPTAGVEDKRTAGKVSPLGTAGPRTYAKGTKALLSLTARTLDGTIVDSTAKMGIDPFELRLGREFVVQGLERAVHTLQVGERALFFCSEDAATGYPTLGKALRAERVNRQNAEKGLPPSASGMGGGGCAGAAMAQMADEHADLMKLFGCGMVFDVRLLDVKLAGEYEREEWEVSGDERVGRIPQLKEAGNAAYSAGAYDEAIERYREALAYADNYVPFDMDGQDKVFPYDFDLDATKLSLRLNMAQAHIKQGDCGAAIEVTSALLGEEATKDNVKALFRRAVATIMLGTSLDRAESDLDRVLELDASLAADVQRQRRKIALARKMASKREKAMFSGVLGK